MYETKTKKEKSRHSLSQASSLSSFIHDLCIEVQAALFIIYSDAFAEQFLIRSLQMVRHLWTESGAKGAIAAIVKLPDHSVRVQPPSIGRLFFVA